MQIDLNNVDIGWFRSRLNRVAYLVMVVFVILLARLFYLQIIEGADLRRQSASNSIRLQYIDSPRGLIFDRNQTLLADNRPAFNLQIVPKDAQPLGQTLEKITAYLNIGPEVLAARLEGARRIPRYKPVLLQTDIDRDMLAAFEARKYDLPGMSVDVLAQRQYMDAVDVAHIIGYLSEINADELRQKKYADYRGGDRIGKFGAEKAYENYLKGERGGRQVEVNATGQVVGVLKTVPAKPGSSVYLTIDLKLQHKATQLLAGRAGAVVAIDPNNGEILALASSPSYDPNDFVTGMSSATWRKLINDPLHPLVNKAIRGEYPPASTFKIITAMAGLEEGVINVNSTFFCPGYLQLGNRTFRCWKKGGHGRLNVIRALAESCDVFFYNVGLQLGIDRLAWYAKACGLGGATGLNLDQESKGLIPTSGWKRRRFGRSWQKGETLTIAIGQGYTLATPLQMADFIAAVANGGKRYRPQLLKEVRTWDGQLTFSDRPEIVGQLPASPATMKLIRQGLFEAVNTRHGTAYGVRSKKMQVSGKTGTAQVAARGQDEKGKKKQKKYALRDHAWFVGYGPSESPRIAVAVMIEHGEHGSSAAAPVAMEMIDTYLEMEKPSLQAATAKVTGES